ncbi:MAG TPA: hypothetical protein VHJ59_07030 [Nitrososphaera sp.]|nr:hypothetical protein [Nitrososphaera sp.]
MSASSGVLFSGQLIVVPLDKESPRYIYEESRFANNRNTAADSVCIQV